MILASAPSAECLAQPDLAEARLAGLMVSRQDGAWQVEVELFHKGAIQTACFDGIVHCLLAGMPADGIEQVACVQVRQVSAAMREDLQIGDDRVAVRFEFTSGSSLLVVCAGFSMASPS